MGRINFRAAVAQIIICSIGLGLLGCAGNATGGNSNGGGPGGGGGVTANAQGTVLLPNGGQGVAIVHIEDNFGNLLSTPLVTNLKAAGPVTVIAESPDLSQGLVASGQSLQTLNDAATSPKIVDNLSVAGFGSPVSAAVLSDSTFSNVQMSQVTDWFTTCFTGGLHMAQGQTISAGQAQVMAVNASPDGNWMAQWDTDGSLAMWGVTATTNPHAVSFYGPWWFSVAPPIIGGRGALAFSSNSSILLQGGSDGSLNAFTLNSSNGNWTQGTQVFLQGNPAVASIAFAPGGQYAIVATNAGLFTITVDGSGSPVVVSGPANLPYRAADGNTYQLLGAQSIAITQDGKYLVALTDQPSSANGTLVAMPVDASGNVGSAGITKSGFLANPNMDVLFAH